MDDFLAKLAQQVSYYDAGGGKKDAFEKDLQTGSQVSDLVGNTIKDILAIKKERLAQRGTLQTLTPAGERLGMPSEQLASQQQSTRVPENIYPQPTETLQNTPSATPAPVAPLVQQRQEIMAKNPNINPKLTFDENKDVASINALSARANAQEEMLPIAGLPQEARDRAIAAGFDPHGSINLKKFNAFKTTDPAALVNTYKPEDALKGGKIEGNARVIDPKGFGIGDLSPGQQSAAFKLRDDFRTDSVDFVKKRNSFNNVISSRKDAETSGGGASDLALIYAFTKLQDPTMVTEVEIQNARKTGNISEQAKAAFEQYYSGGKLTPEMRDNLVAVARRIYDESANQQTDLAGQYEATGKKLGIPRDLFIIDYGTMDSRVNKEDKTKAVAKPGKYDDYLNKFEESDKAINGLVLEKGVSEQEANKIVDDYLSRQ